jgi:predicted double-glycine peptidase
MPLFYIGLHILAALLCGYAILQTRRRPAIGYIIAVAVWALVAAGFLVERHTEWAWKIMPYAGTGLVFCTNLTLEGVCALFALMWRAAARQEERLRAGMFFVPLLAVSLWSYSWYFAPLPEGIQGRVNLRGLLRQTTDDSCSAAAAAMLLYRYGIPATEAEMAQLCLTRADQGTSPLGLFRGLAIKAAERGLHPRLVRIARPDLLRNLKQPAIINVGLKADTLWETRIKMQDYGWRVGLWHTVLVQGTDASGQWIEVADPTNGAERWPADDLNYLWDGSALILTGR